jgi:flavin-dependent dehydrogenase
VHRGGLSRGATMRPSPGRDFDCAVIGGGPAGAACARKLVAEGLTTVVIERRRIPRAKACSGILVDGAVDFVEEHFGKIPDAVFAAPSRYQGWTWHFPRGGRLVLSGVRPPLSIRRSRFDAWLLERSGAQVRDDCRYLRHREADDGIECELGRGTQVERLRCRYLVGADGGRSSVLANLDPAFHARQRWIAAFQVYVEGRSDLAPDFFHQFFDPELGAFNPCVGVKDDLLLIHSSAFVGSPPGPRANWQILVRHLQTHHGLEIRRTVRSEGAFFNLMAPANRFFLGRGRVLLAGEAAGFLHAFGEGLSCALRSGELAGSAIAEHVRTPERLLPAIYREQADGELRRVLDSWSPVFGGAQPEFAIDPRGMRRQFRPRHAWVLPDLLRCMRPCYEKGRGPQTLGSVVRRLLTGRYAINDESSRPGAE